MPYSPERQAKWREENRRWQRNYNLVRTYDLSLEGYEELVEDQDGRCLICGRDPSDGEYTGRNYKRLHIDHDHRTGKIRGLLCPNCNRGLGMFGDSPETLSRAAAYLAERG